MMDIELRLSKAFDALKMAIIESLFFLSDLNKLFELHVNASDSVISGVLMQEGHSIAFKSRKLNDTKRRHMA